MQQLGNDQETIPTIPRAKDQRLFDAMTNRAILLGHTILNLESKVIKASGIIITAIILTTAINIHTSMISSEVIEKVTQLEMKLNGVNESCIYINLQSIKILQNVRKDFQNIESTILNKHTETENQIISELSRIRQNLLEKNIKSDTDLLKYAREIKEIAITLAQKKNNFEKSAIRSEIIGSLLNSKT